MLTRVITQLKIRSNIAALSSWDTGRDGYGAMPLGDQHGIQYVRSIVTAGVGGAPAGPSGRSPSADGVLPAAIFAQDVAAYLYASNGVGSDRVKLCDATLAAAPVSTGVLAYNRPGDWTATNAPALGVAASTTKPAGGVGVVHICTSISCAISAASTGFIVLRDGASGAGAILWQSLLQQVFQNGYFSNLAIVGSPNTAMTVEFTAGDVGVQKTVSVCGYDVA